MKRPLCLVTVIPLFLRSASSAAIQNSGCSFCSIDDATDPDLVVDFSGSDASQWTCGDLVDLAPSVRDTSLCQELQNLIPTCCSDSGGDAVLQQTIMTCTLCGASPRDPEVGRSSNTAGSIMVMGFLNRSIPVIGTGRSSSQQLQTCQEINEALSQNPLVINDVEDGSQACSDQRNNWMEERDIYLDLPSYCGCPGASAPQVCEFACASGSSHVINEDLVVDKLGDGTKLTCGDILSAIPYIVDFDVCQDYQKYQSLCCANFEASCHLCQPTNGASVSLKHSEKIIPSLQLTCGLMDQYFGTVLDVNNADITQECNDYREDKNENTIVDLESYCGCDLAVAPNNCGFCAVESMTDPNLLLSTSHHSREAIDKLDDWGIAGNSMTCRAVAELAPIVTNDAFCQDLQYFRPLCCPEFEATCTLCASGATLTKPDAVLGGRNKETCAKADQQYFHLIQGDAAACNAQRDGFHSDMDVQAYCGCPGQEPPNQCNFCDPSDLIDPELEIGIGSDARTCGYLAEIAPFLTNQTLCDWLEFAKPQCCPPKIGESCSICSNGSTMSQPNNVVEHRKGTTCLQLDQTIQKLPNDDICVQVKADWDFDLESFCGCGGSAPAQKNRCELCPKDQVLRNHSVALPDKPSWTCEMGHEQAPFVDSKVVCEMELQTQANIEVCCGPSTSTSPDSSSGNSTFTDPKPISMEAAGFSDTMLWLATAIEVMIILVFLLLWKHELTMIASVTPNMATIPETAALI